MVRSGIGMSNDLRDELDDLLQSASGSNPALNALLDDYARYHLVFIAVGGIFLLSFMLLAVVTWRRFRRTPRSANRRWSLERAIYLCGSALSSAAAGIMALLVAANLSNVANPRHGFSGAVGMIGDPAPGSGGAELHRAFLDWLQTGTPATPDRVSAAIDARLAWQRPKAIICSVLLVVCVVVCARVWRHVIVRSRAHAARWTTRDVARLASGVGAGLVCLLLMLMVIGNAQASLAPLSMTLFYG
jgi:hypothetical protein